MPSPSAGGVRARVAAASPMGLVHAWTTRRWVEVEIRQHAPGARGPVALAAAMGLVAAAGCGSSSSASSPATTHTKSSAVSLTSQCGTKPGVKATGTPIPLGGIVTNQPGTSFTDIATMADAYFTCVNNN